MSATRERLDQLVTTRGLAESREKAQRLILAGQVRVNGQPATKPGQTVAADAEILIEGKDPFVSRGGQKLEHALQVFAIDVKDQLCLDVGASTGGFTDCLLQHGARKIYAVDVGTAQLHWQLRNDPRVVVMEHINARHLAPANFPEPPTTAVMDVSFISLTKVLPAVTNCLLAPGQLVTLIKPQFEAGREDVGRGGVVRDPAVRERVIQTVRTFGETQVGLHWQGVCESPLRGPAGNVEFLAYWKKQ